MRLALFGFLVFLCFCAQFCESKTKKSTTKQLSNFFLQSKETTPVNFLRLVVMRLIFGVASMMGFRENISEFLGGVFVPPGADYDDYDGEEDIISDIF